MGSIDPDFLSNKFTQFYSFIPTVDLMKKLITRMTQIKCEEKDLWEGFHPPEDGLKEKIIEKLGYCTYHPNQMLEPYAIGETL